MEPYSRVTSSENILIINHNTLTFHHHNLLMGMINKPEFANLVIDKRTLMYNELQWLGYLMKENQSPNFLHIFDKKATMDDYKNILRSHYATMKCTCTDLYRDLNNIFSSKYLSGYILKEVNDNSLSFSSSKYTIMETDDIFSFDNIMKVIEEKKITTLVADNVEFILRVARVTKGMSFMYPKYAYNMQYSDKYKTDIVKFSDEFDELEILNKHEYIEYEPFASIDPILFAVG